jgi:hypothetical protein
MCARNGTPGLRGFVVLLAIAGLAGAAATPSNASPAARLDATTPTTFTDPTGDSGTAPDITSVVVSNDAARTITFRINVDKLAVPSDVRFLIAIDSDQNASTGESGTDYLLVGDLSDNTFGMARWDGSQFVDMPATTVTASNDPTGITFTVNSSDLGGSTAFNFWTRALQGTNAGPGLMDDAPDSGSWSYQLGSSTPLVLTVGLAHISRAQAGRRVAAVITVARSDGTVADVTPNDVSCSARIGSQAVPVGSRFALGPVATCVWRLPARSRGKTVRASVTVTLDGATVTRTFAVRVH